MLAARKQSMDPYMYNNAAHITLTHSLDRNAPYVGVDIRILPAPHVQHVEGQIPRKERGDRDKATEQMETHQAPSHPEQEAKQIVGRPATGPGVVRTASLVLLGELVQHVQAHEGVDAERADVQEGREEAPHVEAIADGGEVVDELVCWDDAEVARQGQAGGAAEPVAGDEREGVEPVGYARSVVHPGGLVGRRHGDENDLLQRPL